MALTWWRKNRCQILFYKSCGTLICLRIIPVKLDRSLTGIIRTYINFTSFTVLQYCWFFHSRLNVDVQVNFSPQFYVHINAKLFIHAFMHLCLVRLWLLCGGEKTGKSKKIFIILVVR